MFRFGARRRTIAALLTAATLSACSSGSSAVAPTNFLQTPGAQQIWVTAWGQPMSNAVQAANNPASSEQTFRFIVKPTVGSRGSARIHISNLAGTAPLTIGAMHVGLSTGSAAVTSGDTPVLFGGAPTITVPVGSAVYSDPVALTFSYGAKVAVTAYVSGSWSSLPQHLVGGVVTNYATAPGAGDRTSDLAGTSFTQKIAETFFVDRFDLLGSYTGTVAFAGSSTVIGYGSDPNAYDDLVNDIAANLHAAGRDDLALANMSLIADALLSKNNATGNPPVLDRLQTDFLSLPGIRTIVQAAGDVDLKGTTCSPATDLIAGNQSLIATGHAAGVRVVLATVAPSTYCNGNNPSGFGTRFAAGSGQDGQRQLLNAWILSTAPSTVSGVAELPPTADAVVDLSTPVTDPTNTGYLLPQYDSGDDSHVTTAGQALQAKAFANVTL